MALTSTSTTTQEVATTAISAKRSLYPEGVPYKFSSDGDVQYYPGNTTLCHVPSDSVILPGLQALYDELSAHPRFLGRMSLLPPASWHMTVLDGVREEECEPGMWPPGRPKKPLAESTREFSRSLRQLGDGLEEEGLAPPYRMKIVNIDAGPVGIGIQVEGATSTEEARMRKLRDRLSDTLGFRAPNHTIYGFHISMAYFLRHMDVEDVAELNRVFANHQEALYREFNLGAVEFCTFDNMHSFPRLFYIEKP